MTAASALSRRSATLTHGDAEDFTEYVAARRGTLLRAAAQLTPNPADAEDLLQEGLVKVYGAWGRIADKRVAHAYVRRTMSNHQISQWRRNRVEEYPSSDDLPDTAVWDRSKVTDS